MISNGEPICTFLIQPTKDADVYIAGDAVLRSMYVVFDLDNGQASIAQAKVNNTDSPDVVTVKAGPSGVAEALMGGCLCRIAWAALQLPSTPHLIIRLHRS